MNKETRKPVQIPFEDKNDDKILDTLIPSNFRYAQIEKDEDGKLFTSGHFDLVVCDEAHRSIYNNGERFFSAVDVR